MPPEIVRYRYDRDAQKVGIVHFGIGAFHRAHQAWYTDLAMDAGDRDWAISGVSLRSRSVAEQLNPQAGLYTLTERSGESSATRLIGSVSEVLYAPEEGEAVVERIASPDCHIVSFTVTEKGYARGAADALDFERARASFYPLLAEGLERRCQRGLCGITLLSCDNLADNGRVLGALMRKWLAVEAPQLLDWFARECTVPATMIDRIVPRTSAEDLAALDERLGLEDRAAVFTEAFSQWVIEDDFAGPHPRWEAQGVQLVKDVAPFETAKLRMLNGAHSLLAYCGLRAGHEFVHEAVADPALCSLAERLMRDEAMPTINAASGQDLAAYADQLLARFADPALRHRLSQIAMDGTQKIPQRWLDTVRALRSKGQEPVALCEAFDAWLWHLKDGRFVDDPCGEELSRLARSGGRDAVLARCFGSDKGTPAIWPGYEDLHGSFASVAVQSSGAA
ncbi:mannitol dehydrogenase family protein [Altererythrobacter sp. Z27]|uniref:mannitol dehydrogenase family protein n=1 Tax=Altererythrobacter sp. Z27 TaxID=3461147 RepID=UPI004044CEC0